MLFRKQHSGFELIMVIILMGMIVAIGLAVLQLVGSQNTLSTREIRQQQTFQVAEAGANYYRWRLAHYPADYQDGTGAAGPYVHDFKDTTGKTIGRYELAITPPVTGSTISTVVSTGYLLTNPNAKRTLTIQLGLPSLSKYAVVSASNLRFGAGTETFGPLHSNGGIHFDGIAHGLVTSAQTTYTDPDGYGTQPGVWSLNANPDTTTFLGGRQVGVTTVDFNGITVDLATLKTAATNNGLLLPSSGAQGYHITFRADDKIDIRKVVTQLRCQYSAGSFYDFGYCSNNFNRPCSQDSTCGGAPNKCILSSFSIGSRAADQVDYQIGVAIPANGIIFSPEDAWVDGTIDTARATVVAGAYPLDSGTANIYINKDLTYAHGNTGQEAVGLIAQNNILTGYFSKNDIVIDAALIAQKGRVGRPYYGSAFTSSSSNANFQLYPTTGMCTANQSRTCAANGDCNNYCQVNTGRACTSTANCNNYCQIKTGRACTSTANCNNYCTADTTKSCTSTANCINYCSGDKTRSCTSANQCKNWCSGDHTKGCTSNANCTGFGTCVSTSNVGPCVTATTGPCVAGDSCVTTDSCVTGDTCSLSKNPDGGTTCQEYRVRNSLTTLGSIATNQRYGFAWTGSNNFTCTGLPNNDSGYCTRSLIFDSNLIFAPAPSFPSSGQYSILSYTEK